MVSVLISSWFHLSQRSVLPALPPCGEAKPLPPEQGARGVAGDIYHALNFGDPEATQSYAAETMLMR